MRVDIRHAPRGSAGLKHAIPSFHQRPSAPTDLTLHQAVDINVPIASGDGPVRPDDVIVGDADGCIVIPAHLGDEIADEAVKNDGVRGFRHREGARRPLDHGALSAAERSDDEAGLRDLAEGARALMMPIVWTNA
jgi:hypothetical protein